MDPPRKRLQRWESFLKPRFLTFSCLHRLPLLRHPTIASAFVLSLERARARHGFKLVAWVVMPEHVHLLIVPRPKREESGKVVVSVSGLLAGVKRPVASIAIARWRELKWEGLARLVDGGGNYRFWQPGGGFDRTIRDPAEFAETVEYIHQNPAKRGLVAEPTEYRWSSARWYAGSEDGPVRVDRYRYGDRWEWWKEEE